MKFKDDVTGWLLFVGVVLYALGSGAAFFFFPAALGPMAVILVVLAVCACLVGAIRAFRG